MIDFELIEDEDLLHEYKCLFDMLSNSELSEAEEKRLEKQIDVCEIEILTRMNKRKYQNEYN